MGKLKEIDTIASDMVNVFEQHSKTYAVASDDYVGPAQTYVSEEGMQQLGDIFDRVPMTLRPAVFEVFISRLQEKGINYSLDNMIGTVH